ncbi:MAG: hypothetical protein JNL68_16990 [Burkholderiales bacterium]|nr:hypothetical protein [Burkholderiales bacterium]
MKVLEYTVRFITPAFLGDAEQNGRWRTPPFKALLRQWWRVAYAADKNFNVDVDGMRREEGLLFGNAWLEDSFCKSQVRLRLSRWNEGQLKKAQWPADASVSHPEVANRDNKLVPIGSSLYLGYGPLTYDKERSATGLKANAAIQAHDEAIFSLAYPEATATRIDRSLWLIDRYGTLGGRGRNGWGSFALLPSDELGAAEPPLRAWQECLDRDCDWPHAIGRDAKGALIWQTQPFDDWKALMKRLAEIKIGLRTQFCFEHGNNAPNPEPRHWLSYPVTNHSVSSWSNNARLPNTLRFKVRANSDGKLVGVIFHMPHLPPSAFLPNRPAIEGVWNKAHRFLDQPAQRLTRIPA